MPFQYKDAVLRLIWIMWNICPGNYYWATQLLSTGHVTAAHLKIEYLQISSTGTLSWNELHDSDRITWHQDSKSMNERIINILYCHLVIVQPTILKRDMWCGFFWCRWTDVEPALRHVYITIFSLLFWNIYIACYWYREHCYETALD